ncbi:MAG: tetratricopeptide repeat-containing sensor histidine kinase [Bacteroidia bacterium]
MGFQRKNSITQLEVYECLGNIYKNLYLSDSAIYYFEIYNKKLGENASVQKLLAIRELSSLHTKNGSDSKALDYCINGIRVANALNNNESVAGFNSKMGKIYAQQGNQSKAVDYYKRALSIYNDIGQKLGAANVYTNIGTALINKSNLDSAEFFFEKAKVIFESESDKAGIANMIAKLGFIRFLEKDYQKAIQLQKSALGIRIANNFLDDLPQSYVELANTYLELKRYDDALELTREGFVVTKKTGSAVQLLSLYNQFYLIYKDLNYKDSALWYHEKYALIKDSVDQMQNDEMVIRLQNAFDTERRELELAEIKRENEVNEERLNNYKVLEQKDNYLKLLLSSVILILLIVAALFFSRYRIKSKANDEISRKVKENELLLKELHHRVKNNLQFISSLLAIKSNKIKDPVAQQMVEESLQKVRAMSLVHNKLNLNPADDPNLNLKSFLQGLTESLVLSLGLDFDQLEFTYKWRKASFDLDSFNSIGLVINEMITNSFKHCDADNLNIKIGFFENNKYKMIRYWDNGPGLDENFFLNDKQMGITLMRLLAEDLGGTFKYDQPKEGEKGIRINININKNVKNG